MTIILIVEDNKNQRFLYEQELKLEGYEVVKASDGEEGLGKAQKQPILITYVHSSQDSFQGLYCHYYTNLIIMAFMYHRFHYRGLKGQL